MDPIAGAYEQSMRVGLRGARAYHARQLRRDRIIAVLFAAAVALGAFALSPWLILIEIFAFLLWTGLMDDLLMRIRVLYWRNPELNQRVEVSADNDGVTYRTSRSATQVKWSAYRRLVEGPDAFVLEYGRDMIHIIPVETFADPEAFRQLARAKVRV